MVVQIGKESLADFAAGDGIVGTAAAQLPGRTVVKHVVVRANGGNSNVVMVGNSAAQAAIGFVLAAGEQTPPIYIDDLSKIWVIGGAATQGYSWIAS